MPAVFPPQVWPEFNYALMDGGTEWNTNMVSAIHWCRDKGFEDQDIVIDIINNWTYSEKNFNKDDTLDNILRYRNIKSYYKSMDDIVEFKQAFSDIDFRYYFNPSEEFTGYMMQFSPKTTLQAMEVGRKDGSNLDRAKKDMSNLGSATKVKSDIQIVQK